MSSDVQTAIDCKHPNAHAIAVDASWCPDCGAVKSGCDDWALPAWQITALVVPSSALPAAAEPAQSLGDRLQAMFDAPNPLDALAGNPDVSRAEASITKRAALQMALRAAHDLKQARNLALHLERILLCALETHGRMRFTNAELEAAGSRSLKVRSDRDGLGNGVLFVETHAKPAQPQEAQAQG
jgi:hypothetical protein